MVEYCTFYKDVKGLSKVLLVLKSVAIVAIGIAGLTIGTSTSLNEIIKTFFVDEGHHHS